MSQNKKPVGLYGRIIARGMAWGHRDFYEHTAQALELKPEDTYLEIGFGSGYFIKKYASFVSAIAGIDYSEDMVELAKAINKDIVNRKAADFRQGDVNSLSWPSERFSAAAAIETFYFWKEPLSALREIHRVLAPGGRLVIEMAYNKEDGLDHSKAIKRMSLNLYSAEEMIKVLEESCFSDIQSFYYQGFRVPLKGYIVPKGMIMKAIRK